MRKDFEFIETPSIKETTKKHINKKLETSQNSTILIFICKYYNHYTFKHTTLSSDYKG